MINLLLILSLMVSCSFKSNTKNNNPHNTNGKPPATPPLQSNHPMLALSDAAYLRKLSFHIRGIPPSSAEYRALIEAQKNKTATVYLKSVIKNFIQSAYHVEKMNNRLNEYFKLRADTYFETADWPVLKEELALEKSGDFNASSYLQSYLHNNSLNDLFRTMIRENQSWDQILLKKSYRVNMNTRNHIYGSISDKDFYYPLAKKQLSTNGNEIVNLHFEPNDSRIAGALTTSRFFDRYPNTAVNKNRKRAATIFRMFLCDSMNTIALDSSPDEGRILKMVFPQNSDTKEPTIKPGDPHGKDPACMKCHYKLDPAGLTFSTSPLSLSPFASPGALVFKRSESEKVNIPVEGLGTLARRITEQPEYVQCQIQQLWNWFVDKENSINPTSMQEIQQNFEKVGRRANDFIEYLVSTPQFMSRAQLPSDNELEQKVKVIFKRCDSCHKEEENIPLFAQWPIGGSEAAMKNYLRKITKHLDLKGDGNEADMPPAKSDWRLSAQERSALQLWVQKQTELKEETIQTSLASVNAVNAGYLGLVVNPPQLRYISGQDLILTLVNKFTLWKSKDTTTGVESTTLPFYCRFAAEDTATKVGIASPKTGQPIHNPPSPSMARWYYECGELYINADLQNSLKQLQLEHYFSSELQKRFQLNKFESLNTFLKQHWNIIHPDIQLQLLTFWVEYLLGPDELISDLTQGQFPTQKEFAAAFMQKIPEAWHSMTLQELIPKINLLLIMQDVFLQY